VAAWLVSVPGFGVKKRDGEGDLTVATGGVDVLIRVRDDGQFETGVARFEHEA
jgi:hypothetical protein